MLVAVILGNRINDDGSMSDLMKKRLKTALEIDKLYNPSKIILSGGIANKKAVVSEAQMMYDFLADNGVDRDKLIMEDKSLTTKQNAEFSVPIAAQAGADELLLCTSTEHMCRPYLNPIKLFQKQLRSYPQIVLKAYCE
ncbi:MAG: YdcF family protein [Corallococcus sp.]|nr:YdcF family protein [Bacillota bacterium]MCM1534162.1 YdcF family protein [Corallococcus sp.]